MSISTASISNSGCCSHSLSSMSEHLTLGTIRSAAQHHIREGAHDHNQADGWRQRNRLPHPKHQTCSWRPSRTDAHHVYERSHMRFVVDTSALPLSEFRSTKELAMAIRDAIKGHRLMMEHGGALHRDVSSDNILIVEESQENFHSKGFLHDYDYSSMTLDSPIKASTRVSSEPSPLRPLELQQFADVANCKGGTGTYCFMALDLVRPGITVDAHNSSHDLESSFWVLLWIVLRHTDYERKDGDEALCTRTFKYGDDGDAADAKLAWLDRSDVFDPVLAIPGNPALAALLNDFHALVYKANKGRGRDRVALTYDAVLRVFDNAIERDDWPVGDKAIPYYQLTELRTRQSLSPGLDSKAQIGDKRPRVLEDDGVQSNSEDEDEMESMMPLSSSASVTAPAKRPKMTPVRFSSPTVKASTSRDRRSRGSSNRSGKGETRREQGPEASRSKGKKTSEVRNVSRA